MRRSRRGWQKDFNYHERWILVTIAANPSSALSKQVIRGAAGMTREVGMVLLGRVSRPRKAAVQLANRIKRWHTHNKVRLR